MVDKNKALLRGQLPQDIKSMILDEQKLRDSGLPVAGDIAEALDLSASDTWFNASFRKLLGAQRQMERRVTRSRVAKKFVEERSKTMTDDDKIRWVKTHLTQCFRKILLPLK